MFKPVPLFIGLRYMRAKRRNHFISFISLMSMMGIALGVWALIVVISVMNGFEHELRSRILSMASHATLSGYGGGIEDWEFALAKAKQHPDVEGAAPYINAEAMLTYRQLVKGTLIRGINTELEPEVSVVTEKLVEGKVTDLKAGEFNIILGRELANSLGVMVGDKVTLVAPQARVTPAGVMPRLRRFNVTGIFAVNMHEFDAALALVHIDDAAKLFRLKDSVTGIRLKLNDMMDAPMVSRELAGKLSGNYYVRDWTQQHANFFRAIKTEKTVMFVILTLVVAVAAFNIVSTLIMVVTDKQSDIAILRTLGMSPRNIMTVFIVQGSLSGFIGTFIGVFLGVVTALNIETIVPAIERFFKVQFLPADVYYISDLPSRIHNADVLVIAMVSLILTMIATIYPAWRAAQVQPAEALRYE